MLTEHLKEAAEHIAHLKALLHEEAASRGCTYREWVAKHTGRKGADLIADESAPDVVYGLWTCCESLNPDALGCVRTQHSDAGRSAA